MRQTTVPGIPTRNKVPRGKPGGDESSPLWGYCLGDLHTSVPRIQDREREQRHRVPVEVLGLGNNSVYSAIDNGGLQEFGGEWNPKSMDAHFPDPLGTPALHSSRAFCFWHLPGIGFFAFEMG